MNLNNKTAKTLRKDFPIFRYNKGLVYLDNAATSQKPKQVIKIITDFYEKSNANIYRGVYKLSEKATELYLKSKKIVARFINAHPDEIIYTKNATESLNFLSYVLPSIVPKNKNEIVLTEMEHHSNLIPWQQLEKRGGFKTKFIRIKEGVLDLNDVVKKITLKTAIVSVCHISNSLGIINPVKEIIKLAKSKKAITILDASQSVPHIKVDVKELDCDFLVFSGHKALGPDGIGVLYGKREILERMPPFMFGGGMIKKVGLESSKWAEVPERFEAGTPNIAGAIALGEAIKYIQRIGIENIEMWERQLLIYSISKLKEIKGIKIYNFSKTFENNSGILSFNLEKIHPHDVASFLDDYGVAIRAGHHCNMPLMKKLKVHGTCRISFYFYNTFEDIDRLVESLKKIQENFR